MDANYESQENDKGELQTLWGAPSRLVPMRLVTQEDGERHIIIGRQEVESGKGNLDLFIPCENCLLKVAYSSVKHMTGIYVSVSKPSPVL